MHNRSNIKFGIWGILFFFLLTGILRAEHTRQPIATDSRIKTFVYSENEVFPIVLHYGYQTTIEFGKDEKIQTYSVGNNYAWQFNNVGRTLFIKPLEENISTNMILLTSKRRYYFELQSRTLLDAADQDLVYAIRFFYPDNEEDIVAPQVLMSEDSDQSTIPVIKSYDFDYQIKGSKKNAPNSVFDNGISTFIQYENGITIIPKIKIFANKNSTEIEPRRIGNYLVIDNICEKIELKYETEVVSITKVKNKIK
jgi:type IV secretion system protein VirB9